MTNAAKIRLSTFSGLSKVYSHSNDGLAAMIRGIAQDLARSKLEVAGINDLTDNSTGTAASAYVNMPLPTASIDATSAGGVAASNLNTSLGTTRNALKVLANSVNNVNARLGLPLLVCGFGTQATADTIPSQTTSSTGGTGASATDFDSAVASMRAVRNDVASVMVAVNDILAAIDEPVLAPHQGPFTASHTLATIPAVTTSAAGLSSVSKTNMDAFLLAVANNLATLAFRWNSAMTQGTFTTLTDSSGGTAALTLVANPFPAPANGAATTSAPKAGFDTQLNVIENAISEIAAKANILLREYDLPTLTDSTGQSQNGVIEAISIALTAVDGSSGTSAVDQVTALARMATVKNAVSSLGAVLNELAPNFGVPTVTDNLGGTVSTTLADIAATATGVGGATGTPTLLNADVDTWLSNTRNNLSTLAALANEMLASTAPNKPLHVVAAL